MTDALDDDETPLRLTAFHTATMVSGIMGALEITDVTLRGAWPANQWRGVDQGDGRIHCAHLRSPHGTWA